ncbi:MAG: hypothetical protein CM1200mP18_21510 [Gammaproteobacteria bacterium]|nr:MAG: hypothetical protein CM1200mP18_21510 [Gammaproteobacteria bacterium]
MKTGRSPVPRGGQRPPFRVVFLIEAPRRACYDRGRRFQDRRGVRDHRGPGHAFQYLDFQFVPGCVCSMATKAMDRQLPT